ISLIKILLTTKINKKVKKRLKHGKYLFINISMILDSKFTITLIKIPLMTKINTPIKSCSYYIYTKFTKSFFISS
ncbi:hypothetical protein KSS87_019251, partial [Heliosperma pusillum]